jgi:hypothetical protein
MHKLQRWTAETQKKYPAPANLGTSLVEHQKDAKIHGSSKLERFLDGIARQTNDLAWLASVYARYLSYQRRRNSPLYSETGDLEEEHNLMKKEFLCILTNRIMNELQPQWGVYSILVFSALRGTGYNAYMVTNANRSYCRDQVQGFLSLQGGWKAETH